MEWIFGLVAFIAALGGLVAALGHGGYVYMLGSVAKKKGAGGEPIAKFARGRYGIAAAGVGAGIIGLLFTLGDSFGVDLVGLLIGLGTIGASTKALQTSKEGLRLGGRTR
ncbi:hypothetical protein [Sciscionella marina]|uniref:hypothetical protein n=1 Tax=Sciscionella marina TaxID=508770 RepID=UPI000368C540|nr:hypothetical protein [Sciscionella marina]